MQPAVETRNGDTRAAWRYHDGTKHPSGRLMNPGHAFDPRRRPTPFKTYVDLEPMPLPLDRSSGPISALSAISSTQHTVDSETVPDVGALARVLYFSAGLTRVITYRGGEMQFRAAACTGALYHIELYLVCGDVPGLEAGVYHFAPDRMGLAPLRSGDHRAVLVNATGQEPAVAEAPAILVYTDVFWRNACKYQAREYRHAFWDCGTILAHTLATASACGLHSRVVTGFVDDAVNALLDTDPRREAAIALVPLGRAPGMTAGPAPEVGRLSHRTAPMAGREVECPAITEMHLASSLKSETEVESWRVGIGTVPPVSSNPALGSPTGPTAAAKAAEPSPGRRYDLRPHQEQDEPADPLEAVILRRGSTRRFSRDPMSFADLSTILSRSLQILPADFVAPEGPSLNDVYLIVNSVEGLPPGAYVRHRQPGALELLRTGDFRSQAGHLALDQALPGDASVALFFLADLEGALERLGNRGYRAAQLEASIAAGRVYLAAYALGLGATGLTFYDDAVTQFFSPDASGKSVMFLVAVGKKARRR